MSLTWSSLSENCFRLTTTSTTTTRTSRTSPWTRCTKRQVRGFEARWASFTQKYAHVCALLYLPAPGGKPGSFLHLEGNFGRNFSLDKSNRNPESYSLVTSIGTSAARKVGFYNCSCAHVEIYVGPFWRTMLSDDWSVIQSNLLCLSSKRKLFLVLVCLHSLEHSLLTHTYTVTKLLSTKLHPTMSYFQLLFTFFL